MMSDETDIFADATLRQKQLLEQLEASPVLVVSGVVAPNGPSGGKFRGEELWTLRFTLEGWRVEAADLQTRALRVMREVTHEELRRLQKLILPYTVIRIRARLLIDALSGNAQALLEEYVDIHTSDSELNLHAARLQQPVTFEDGFFGTFTLDRAVDSFSGNAVWNGNIVALTLDAKGDEAVEEALKTAYSLWQSQQVWTQRIADYAVEELLPLKNDSWLNEDEAHVTADQFKTRMTLESITVDPDGSFGFWHNDGDLFWGHSIHISGSLSEGPTDADIPG